MKWQLVLLKGWSHKLIYIPVYKCICDHFDFDINVLHVPLCLTNMLANIKKNSMLDMYEDIKMPVIKYCYQTPVLFLYY